MTEEQIDKFVNENKHLYPMIDFAMRRMLMGDAEHLVRKYMSESEQKLGYDEEDE